MKYTIKKSILSKTAFIALAIAMSSYTYASHNEEKIGSLSTTFTSVENDLSQFVNTNNKTSFNTYIIGLKATMQTFQRVVDSTVRAHGDELSEEIDQLLEYALQQFNILVDVFKRYNGKPDNQAGSFALEIRREFDVEKIFAEMLNKLKALRGKAHQTGNKHLVKQIEELATKIQQKKKLWNAKTDLSLITGLMHRMRCQ